MLVFPNCKINIGLNIVEKRTDNYHNLETAFYPIDWCDALEIIPAKNQFSLVLHGQTTTINPKENLLTTVWRLVNQDVKLNPIEVHLFKNVPIGAGLGGGSSDAAFFIGMLNDYFKLGFSSQKQLQLAASIGSDCPFFIKNTPHFATGKGTELSPLELDLSNYFILAVYPNIHCSTAEAYAGVVPSKPKRNLKRTLENSVIDEWKETVVNDFEESIFAKYPALKDIKRKLYDLGAAYASMSGSGSTLYGIFTTEPDTSAFLPYTTFLQKPKATFL